MLVSSLRRTADIFDIFDNTLLPAPFSLELRQGVRRLHDVRPGPAELPDRRRHHHHVSPASSHCVESICQHPLGSG
ncbi:hypothetical protein [Arthrobacter sp. V4I6]|uniref:hypothetical protein n=1 Tax=Arthrobacter sp. V4I6 TaxID=3042281 RepID=UPI0027D9006F|nr:hypothetical protein [Arthrobacter sp. V4I6]